MKRSMCVQNRISLLVCVSRHGAQQGVGNPAQDIGLMECSPTPYVGRGRDEGLHMKAAPLTARLAKQCRLRSRKRMDVYASAHSAAAAGTYSAVDSSASRAVCSACGAAPAQVGVVRRGSPRCMQHQEAAHIRGPDPANEHGRRATRSRGSGSRDSLPGGRGARASACMVVLAGRGTMPSAKLPLRMASSIRGVQKMTWPRARASVRALGGARGPA